MYRDISIWDNKAKFEICTKQKIFTLSEVSNMGSFSILASSPYLSTVTKHFDTISTCSNDISSFAIIISGISLKSSITNWSRSSWFSLSALSSAQYWSDSSPEAVPALSSSLGRWRWMPMDDHWRITKWQSHFYINWHRITHSWKLFWSSCLVIRWRIDKFSIDWQILFKHHSSSNNNPRHSFDCPIWDS